jgi:hypothetical protein
MVVARCAGLDVAKDEVVACIRVPDERGGRRHETRTFLTFTADLEALADWMASEGVTQVVMEATGQYWKPVWYVLEERGFGLMLVNARHVKIVPGRKTDVKDAEWLAELLEHGLLRGSSEPRSPSSGGPCGAVSVSTTPCSCASPSTTSSTSKRPSPPSTRR